MITRATVLVLGAGASAPYGFPTGPGLVQLVYEELGGGGRGAGALRSVLLETEYSEGDLETFRQELWRSGQPSVDAFLERRPEYIRLGKLAIAAALIPYEVEPNLHRRDGWYLYLWQRLTTPRAEDFGQNQLTVVTLNYDRSLEHFLYLSLRHSHNLDEHAAAERLRRVPVIHLYGQVGDLPYYLGPMDRARAYKPEFDVATLGKWADAIRIFTENVPSGDPNFQAAWVALSEAQIICFLGFGYHEENVERLRVQEVLRERPGRSRPVIYGSTYGIGAGERPGIERLFPHPIRLGDDHLDVLGMLRGHPILG